ncbi:MAG: hypothetical protein U1D30_02115 [Planctomycetota bacterium]
MTIISRINAVSLMRTVILACGMGVLGCGTPLVHEYYSPAPVENEKVKVQVREVNRGRKGGVVTVEVVNVSDYLLETAHGAKAEIQSTEGGTIAPVDLKLFENLVQRYGPMAMGFENWSAAAPPVMLDPLGASLNLQKDEVALLYIAFEADESVKEITIDLCPALVWRNREEVLVRHADPIILEVTLPEVPKTNLPSKDSIRNVHFGIGVSSDDI